MSDKTLTETAATWTSRRKAKAWKRRVLINRTKVEADARRDQDEFWKSVCEQHRRAAMSVMA